MRKLFIALIIFGIVTLAVSVYILTYQPPAASPPPIIGPYQNPFNPNECIKIYGEMSVAWPAVNGTC